MKKLLFFILLFLMSIGIKAQVDPPSSYTQYYGFRMWAQGVQPGADSLNANWQDIDQVMYDLIVAVDPRYFDWKDTAQDTLTLATYAFGTIGFSTGENLYLPYHDSPYSDLGGGAVGYATGGWFVFNNSPNSRIDTMATQYWVRDNYGESSSVVSSIEDLIDVASMTPSAYDILTYSVANGWYNNDISSIVQSEGIDFGETGNATLKLPYAGAASSILTEPRSLYMDGVSGVHPKVHYYDIDTVARQIAVLSIPNTWTAKQSFDTTVVYSTQSGITASVTQSQGQQVLTEMINEISTVGTANDVVTMPTAQTGLRIVIINNGANILQIFPSSGDNFDGVAVDLSTTLASDANAEYVAYDNTTWELL